MEHKIHVPVTTNQVRFLVAPYMVAEKGQLFLASPAGAHPSGRWSHSWWNLISLSRWNRRKIRENKKTIAFSSRVSPFFIIIIIIIHIIHIILPHTLWGLLPFFFFYQPSTSHLLSLVGLDHPYEPSTISRPGRAVRDMERYGEIWRYKASVGPQKNSITKLTKLSGIYYMALIWQLW